ncbi:TlpA family protein disulfide reductase [Parapedobacter sp. DT-150]|uniref:TlpA family protein disulfide reductase n=1 Tax=Parapedobacter sp. DT-150 TaxID=3396162 RepID=UPI003F19C017
MKYNIVMKYSIVYALILVVTSSSALCKNNFNSTIVEGTIKGLPEGATMEILLYNNYVKGTNPYASSQQIPCKLSNGIFHAEIPTTEPFFYVSFGIFHPNQNRQTDYKINRGKLFLVAKGDCLDITITKDTVVTRGTGKELFDCQYRLWSFHSFSTKSASDLYDKGAYDGYFAIYGKLMEGYIREIMAVLEKCRNSLSPYAYDQLYLDWSAKQELDFLNTCWISFHAMKPKGKIALKRFFYNTLLHREIPKIDTVRALFSPYHTAYVLKKEIIDLSFKQIDSVKYKFQFNELLARISQKHGGLLESKLIYTAFDDSGNIQEKSALIDSLLSSAAPDIYAKKLQAYKNTNMAGTQIFPFEFHDTAGRLYTPADFLGKTVMLDFWFTGCIPCQMVAPKLKEFMEHFEERDDIVLVSVNIERSKRSWIKSIEDEKYTSKKYLNLSTGDMANDFIKAYNITSFPRLVIFDETGKIISIDGPLPRNKESSKQLWEMLNN